MPKALQDPTRQESSNSGFQYQLALIDPVLVFDEPSDVVKCTSLTRAQKIQILRLWKYDGRELDIVAEEGTLSNEVNLLVEINAALKALSKTLDLKHERPTKHGGVRRNH